MVLWRFHPTAQYNHTEFIRRSHPLQTSVDTEAFTMSTNHRLDRATNGQQTLHSQLTPGDIRYDSDSQPRPATPFLDMSSGRDKLDLSQKQRTALILLPPTLFVLTISWGFATIIIAWLWSRQIVTDDIPENEIGFFRGALVVREVLRAPTVRLDGSIVPTSKFYGLAIASIAVSTRCRLVHIVKSKMIFRVR